MTQSRYKSSISGKVLVLQNLQELLSGLQLPLVVVGVVSHPVAGDGRLQHLLGQPEGVDECEGAGGELGAETSVDGEDHVRLGAGEEPGGEESGQIFLQR